MAEQFDAIVIGSGQGGNPLAVAMAQQGWKTAIVERRFVGGTCVNVGCTPTKTLVATARVAYLARRAKDFGITTGSVQIDMPAAIARKREIVARSRGSSTKRLTNTANLELIEGDATFTAPHGVAVRLNAGGQRTLTAERIVVDTGVRTHIPQLEGLSTISYLDNESILELEAVPEHLIILGGGVIALEFAQMFRRFGSAVTIVQAGPSLVEHEDEDISTELASILREDGITLLFNAHATSVASDNGILLSVDINGTTQQIHGSHLLLAAGRTPNIETLGLEHAGIELNEHGYIQTDEWLETNIGGVYAVGDVKGGPQFTHISYDDYRVLKANLLDKSYRTIKGRMVPYTIFTDPELGRIGMTEAEARHSGRSIKVAKMPMSYVARAFESAEERGFLKAVVDADTDQILGASCLGVNGGELATQIQIAMMGRITASRLRDATWSHPTWSEALNNLFSKYES
ncbi:MAG TPA: mercuric reductase [Granulicella sp.]